MADSIQIGQFIQSFLRPTIAKAAVATIAVGLVGSTVLYTKNISDKKQIIKKVEIPQETVSVEKTPYITTENVHNQEIEGVKMVEKEIAKTEIGQRTLEFVKEFTTFINQREANKPQANSQSYDQETSHLYFSQYQPSVIELREDFSKQNLSDAGLDYGYQDPSSETHLRDIAAGLVKLASQIE